MILDTKYGLEQVIELADRKKMSAVELATHFGIKPQQMRKYLKGESRMSFDMFVRGINSLGITIVLAKKRCIF